MRHKIFAALMLCMGVFFTPATAMAAGSADTTPPTLSAEASGDTLHITATDSGVGVEAVFVGGRRINYRVDGSVDVSLSDYAEEGEETVEVYAMDFAGNRSDSVWVESPGGGKDISASASTDTEIFTPDGQATVLDSATDEDGKEFYTITTPDENVFFLVIDKQKESDNVYFLNAVTEADLLALAEKDGGDGTGEAVEPEACTCRDRCEAGFVDMGCPVCRNDLSQCVGEEKEAEDAGPEAAEEPAQEKSGNGGTILFLLLAMAAAGGAGYYLKIYRPRHDLDDAEDLDELLIDEPEINEDGEMGNPDGPQGGSPEPERRHGGWPHEAGGGQDGGGRNGREEPGAAAFPDVPYDDYPEDDGPYGDPGGPDEDTGQGD